ncbi:MAG: hypothetical protein KDB68_03825 [Planctomycetes bacterium]|nr:hypothetical protein [Planctomycetota bacterium]
MFRIVSVLSLLAAIVTATVAILAQDNQDPPARQSLELTVNKVEAIKELKAELNDTWKGLPALTFPTRKDPKTFGPDVELRALHDGESIYIMARWKDDTKSTTKKAWEWKEGKWTKSEGDEDRIAIAINGTAKDFETKGCAVLCHYGDMGTASEQEHADLWHWKAARGGLNGFADDQNFSQEPEGRKDDEGKSAYATNANDDGDAPKWVWKDDADKTSSFTEDTSTDLPEEFKPEGNYSVPSYRLRTPEGSRGDIETAAEYKDGWWTVVFKRKLDTGHSDDAAFKAGEDTHIAIAVFDNTGAKTGKEHAKSGAIKLKLNP